MATITASMVKELREKTEAGMMDCKKALTATDGNMEEAVVWLREHGIAKAAKKQGAVAAEGLCSYAISGNKLVTFELNSQTDFVAQNAKFIELLKVVGEIIVNSDATDTESALKVVSNGKDVETIILEASGTIGEKISLRRVNVLTKTDAEFFGAYKHNGGKIVAAVVLNGADAQTAEDLAIHTVAGAPEYIKRSDVPAEVEAKEKEVITNTALNENAQSAKPKPEQIIVDRIVPGRLEKQLNAISLYSQEYTMGEDGQTVEAFLNSKKATVVAFKRIAVGEGIEKVETDFAAEVAAQAAAAAK